MFQVLESKRVKSTLFFHYFLTGYTNNLVLLACMLNKMMLNIIEKVVIHNWKIRRHLKIVFPGQSRIEIPSNNYCY